MPRKNQEYSEEYFSKFRPTRPSTKPVPVLKFDPSKLPELPELPKHPDCAICLEPMVYRRRCRTCHQFWCRDCDKSLFDCPFCRTYIPMRKKS
jgi:hypothetical protein